MQVRTYTDGTPMTEQDRRDYAALSVVLLVSVVLTLAMVDSLFAGVGGFVAFIAGAGALVAAEAVCRRREGTRV